MVVQFPSPTLSPVDVVESQLAAFKAGDVRRSFRFASPSRSREASAQLQKFEALVRRSPAYQPLLGCSRYAVVGALPLGEDRYKCRVRVWPAGSSSAPFAISAPVVDFDWLLSHQPFPVDEEGLKEGRGEGAGSRGGEHGQQEEEDDPLAGLCCWLVDGLQPDASPLDAWGTL
eukprot:CAMPEP_0117656964 /NCGR_PEP_ID=MMETSP0804-20121206/5081_1 /TAXON_ID=1074897 /ORGANISM="Tetraselmis astigmatica, Strain CCMP880" /LENGTH=172 /DNA_ID=CAMNT_0005463393 /DNA_START=273 /DNA_END=791 /DNA_ORIENTATION=+